MKIKINVLVAATNNKYLKITRLDKKDKTLIIFDNQEWIFDYIYYKLDFNFEKLTDWDYEYDLNFLKQLLKKPSDFQVFKTACILKDELKNHWDSFNNMLFANYDSQFYRMDSFDDSCIDLYDYWGNYIPDMFEDEPKSKLKHKLHNTTLDTTLDYDMERYFINYEL